VVLPSLADVIFVIVLMIPGFIALSLLRWLAILERKLSEYHLVLWSLFFSLLIYAIFGLHTGINNIDSMRDNLLIPQNLAEILALGVAFGAVPGLFARFTFRRHFVAGDCWEASMNQASKKGSWVIVHTQDKREYKGYLNYSGGRDSPREISIREPKLILRDDDWNVSKEIKMGKEIFFLEKDIQRIVFFEEV
jgi:hypothetical protein